MFRQILKFLGSLQFAIVLLSVIIVASIVGTIYETSFSADVAKKYIYDAQWFNIWLGALCVNLFCVAAIRYPWKRHQTGFVITHAGIITLLIGAMIDRRWGIEGYIPLYAHQKPVTHIILNEQELRVAIGGESASTNLKLSTLSSELRANSPDPKVKIEIKDAAPIRQSTILVDAEAGDKDIVQGLNYTMEGPMMGRLPGSIGLGESENMGPAEVKFVKGMPPEANSHTVPVPASVELRMLFKGKKFIFPIVSGEAMVKDLAGLPGWKIDIKGFYPNFKLVNNVEPVTVDEDIVRPTVCFNLIGPDVPGVASPNKSDPHTGTAAPQDPTKIAPQQEKFYVYGDDEEPFRKTIHGEPTGALAALFEIKPASSEMAIRSANGVAIFLGADGKLRYLTKHTPRAKGAHADDDAEPVPATEKVGEVELGEPIILGWAPGAQVVVEKYFNSGKRKVIFYPRLDLKEVKEQERLEHGVLCRATIGNVSQELWVAHAEDDMPMVQELDVAGTKVKFDLVNRQVPIPFGVSLKKFSAPRDEGTNDFAAYEAILGFNDAGYDGTQDKVMLKPDSPVAKAQGATKLLGTILDDGSSADIEFLPESTQDIDVSDSETVRVDVQSQRFDSNPGFDGKQDTIWLKDDSKTAEKIGSTKISGLILKDKNHVIRFRLQQFRIEKKDTEGIEKRTQKISMNKPTTFPLSWYMPYFGTCYKFSQASHHILLDKPTLSDPNFSQVQVLRDPGWFLKWFGCIMICFGIFTMFYLRPYFNRPKVAAAPALSAAVAGTGKIEPSTLVAATALPAKETVGAGTGLKDIKKKNKK